MGSPQSLYGYTGSGTTAVIAWNINIIMNKEIINNHLLLPLGHISNSLPLALETIIYLMLMHFTPVAHRCKYASLVA